MGTDTKDILKIVHFVNNAILMLCSLSLVTVFLMAMVHGKQYVDLMGKYTPLYLFATIFILVILMIGTSMLGCFGAANHSIRTLIVYLALVSLLMVLMMTCGIVGWMNKDQAFIEVEEKLKENMEKYVPGSDSNVITQAWDDIQGYLHCCGIKNIKDWSVYSPPYQSATSNKYPSSCTDIADVDNENPYVDGCLDKIEEWTKNNLWNIGAAIAGFIIFMLISICVVCMLIASINAYNSDQYDIEMKNLVHK